MGGGAARMGVEAGEGRVDPATLMILRALAGERGKVDIGGRIYDFSCATTFHLLDRQGGRMMVCEDSLSLLRTILDLLRDAREGQHRRHFAPPPSG
ncbi:MAG TPA: hypothetical protein VNI57_07000 [Candidatus Saccharimonadales bacterium]|nr:hypothetical protein [Candidatus Saccharimonadales bacterium]